MAPKKKQEKMNLGEFLTNQSLGSWADEMDSQPIPAVPSMGGYGSRDRDQGERRAYTQPAWETARTSSRNAPEMGGMRGMDDRGASYDRPRYPDREQLPLPNKPPYTAHLGNLTYDVTQAEIEDFFRDCQVTSVRIVEDKLDRKPKGFGYVEFGTLEGLKQALTLTESDFMGRKVKISVAEPAKDRPEVSRDFSDWSRKGPLPELPQNQRQPSRGFSRNFDNASDAGSERGGSRRPGFFEGDGKVRDFGNWERKGPLSPTPGNGPPVRDGGRVRDAGPPQERRPSPSWGEGRSDAGSRPPRREFEARPPVERAPTAADMDSQWRARMKPDASPVPTPDISTPSSPQQQAAKERPRLNLQKRTVSNADPESGANSSSDSKASPFGAARPIDTATREREVEEKRQLAIRQKKEADDKAKEEKVAKEAAARTARAERADRGQAQEDDKVTTPGAEAPSSKPRRASRQQNGTKPVPKENGEASNAASRASFSILRRDIDGEDGEEADDGAAGDIVGDESAEGAIPGDKEVKPQEIVREVPQNGADGTAQPAETTAETLQDDGWSTVAPKTKNKGRAGGRAIAS